MVSKYKLSLFYSQNIAQTISETTELIITEPKGRVVGRLVGASGFRYMDYCEMNNITTVTFIDGKSRINRVFNKSLEKILSKL